MSWTFSLKQRERRCRAELAVQIDQNRQDVGGPIVTLRMPAIDTLVWFSVLPIRMTGFASSTIVSYSRCCVENENADEVVALICVCQRMYGQSGSNRSMKKEKRL
jgi:hypothetical protein